MRQVRVRRLSEGWSNWFTEDEDIKKELLREPQTIVAVHIEELMDRRQAEEYFKIIHK